MLIPSTVCRYMLFLVLREFEPGTLQRRFDDPAVLHDDLLIRRVEFEHGDLTQSIEDYADNLLVPHAKGFAALLRLADAWQIFDMPLVNGETAARHAFDAMSMKLTADAGRFKFEVLFRPRSVLAKPIARINRTLALPEYRAAA